MTRIPEEEIERLKREVSLVRLVKSSGIELKKKGQDWFGLCPYHDDKTPSLSNMPDKNLWHCLGACQEGGDVFKWVEKMHGVSFTQAFHMLKEQSPEYYEQALLPLKYNFNFVAWSIVGNRFTELFNKRNSPSTKCVFIGSSVIIFFKIKSITTILKY